MNVLLIPMCNLCRHQADALCSPGWQEHQRWWPQARPGPGVPGVGGRAPQPYQHSHTYALTRIPHPPLQKNPLLPSVCLTSPLLPRNVTRQLEGSLSILRFERTTLREHSLKMEPNVKP